MPASQITLRNVDPDLSAQLRVLSQLRGQSLNATVLELLREAVGIDARTERLRRYATWNQEDLREFNEALNAQRVVDEGHWK